MQYLSCIFNFKSSRFGPFLIVFAFLIIGLNILYAYHHFRGQRKKTREEE